MPAPFSWIKNASKLSGKHSGHLGRGLNFPVMTIMMMIYVMCHCRHRQMLYELQTRWDVSLLLHPGVCESFPVFFLTTQYLSPLLVFGFTVERYISVCHPFQRQRYCTTRRAMFTITATVGLALALHAVQGYFWKFYPDTAGTGTCSVRPEVTAGDMTSVWSVWSLVTELLVFGAIPLAILILNVLVIKEMRVVSTSEISRFDAVF